MHSELLSIGNFHIYSYGACIALGVVLAFVFTLWRVKKHYDFDPDLLFNAGLIGVIFGILGAKLLYIIVELDQYIADPSLLLNFGSGFVLYGGVIFGVLAPVIYVKYIKKETILDKLDLCIPAIPLAQACGRVGCLLTGCCYGAPAPQGAWYGITFPDGVVPGMNGVALYPTQAWSAIGDFLLFLFLYWYSERERFRGEVTTFYMMLYAAGRFVIECFRNDDRGMVGSLSTSQFISIFVFAAGVILWIVFFKLNLSPLRRRDNGKNAAAEESGEDTAKVEYVEAVTETVEETVEDGAGQAEETAESRSEEVSEKE